MSQVVYVVSYGEWYEKETVDKVFSTLESAKDYTASIVSEQFKGMTCEYYEEEDSWCWKNKSRHVTIDKRVVE